VIDWIFTQRGAIRVEVAPTGIDVAKSVLSKKLSDPTANADTEHGTIVAPNLVAIYHSHHFNFRLDLDIDGPRNSFSLGRLKKVKTHGSARESVWVLDESTLAREKNAMLDHEGEFLWRVYNPSKKNIYGYNTSYLLESHASVEPLLSDEDTSRAGFIEHPLWVTAYDRDERFAAGDTPNQNPDHPGLPQYVKDNEDITNTDIVLWHTVGFHHVPSAEDYPVLPRESLSFELKPANFFDRNPALDLRRAPFEVTP
jgi:primary-amine oxidase